MIDTREERQCQPDSRLIRISNSVYEEIAKRALSYRETPDAVLRREFGLPSRADERIQKSLNEG